MLGDDKLPPVASTSTQPAPKIGIRNRTCISSGSLILPSINAHRGEFLRPTFSYRGLQSRQGTYYRTRSDSNVITSALPRRTSHDASRYLSNSATKARAIMEKFSEQMKSYHTFQPMFTENDVYNTPGVISHFVGADGWKIVDNLLRASASAAVRHNAEEKFMAGIAHILSSGGNQARCSVEISTNASRHLELLSSSSFSRGEEKFHASLSIWRHEHPVATAEEIRQEQHFWDMESAHRRHLSVLKARQHWQKELNRLIGESPEKRPLRPSSGTPRGRRSPELSDDVFRDRLNQRLLWDVFLVGEVMSKHEAAVSSSAVGVVTKPALAAEIISDYRKNPALQTWMDGKWRHHTHRHENAALRIQCAYRCYRAKVIAAQRGYARRVAFMEERSEEEKYMDNWNNAVCLMKNEFNKSADSVDMTWRALNFVYLKLHATAKARRARKNAEKERECELRTFAAVTIQRVYRGYVGRELARDIRFPELFEQKRQRRLQAAAVVLQAFWRGKRTRAALCQQVAAVLIIQRLVRLTAARVRLRHLRSLKRIDMQLSMRKFAAQVVIRFLKKSVLWRQEYMFGRLEQLKTLQRITRGYIVRLAIIKQRKCVLRSIYLIQRWFRGVYGCKLICLRRKSREAFFCHLRRLDAARVIQRNWRRAIVLRQKANQKDKFEDKNCNKSITLNVNEENASVMIQRWYKSMRKVRRARAERDDMQKNLVLKDSVERIIRFYRAFKLRRSLKLLLDM